MTINKILVAIDGSEKSKEALDKAIEIAEKMDSKIEIINVIEPIKLPAGVYPASMNATAATTPTWMTEYYTEYRKEHEKMLNETYQEAKEKNPDLKVEMIILEGLAATSIVERAEEGEFDLIVLGARGLGFVEELVLGSTSKTVVDKASVPVLVVK